MQIIAKKEVILLSGVVGTPTILQHSGIRDSKLLLSIGVTPLIHLPSVGQNLTDHPFIANMLCIAGTLPCCIVISMLLIYIEK